MCRFITCFAVFLCGSVSFEIKKHETAVFCDSFFLLMNYKRQRQLGDFSGNPSSTQRRDDVVST